MKRDDLVSTKADKGGATLIIDVDNCIEKENKKLKNETYYKEFSHDLTREHTKLLITQLQNFSDNKFCWTIFVTI